MSVSLRSDEADEDRNVQCTVNPHLSQIHNTVYEFSKNLSEGLLPKTSAYHEIWLDQKKVGGDAVQDFEPLYGPTVRSPRHG